MPVFSLIRPTIIGGVTALASLLTPALGAEAQTVGTVSAANPAVYGTAPGGKSHVLAVGADVVFKEQVATNSAGSAQLTFLDRSTINIGANSTVVIDDFVYRPETAGGEMRVKLTKGLMRFVGGQISHTDGVTVVTPTVTVGIRGGVATVGYLRDPRDEDGTQATSRQPGTLVINHFGEMVVSNASSEVRLTRPGFAVFVGATSGAIGVPFRMPPTATQNLASKMSSRPGQHGGAKLAGAPVGGGLPPTTFRVPQPPPLSGLTLSGMISGANNLVRNRTQGQRANQLNQELNARTPAMTSMPAPATTSGPGSTIASPPAQTSMPSQGQTSQGAPATSSQTGGAPSAPTGAPSGNAGNGTPSGQAPTTSIPSGQPSGNQTTVPSGPASGPPQGGSQTTVPPGPPIGPPQLPVPPGPPQGDGPMGHDNGHGNDGQNNGHGNE